ncbi:transporter substrate-binding domain-containing protein [Chromobacterium phragmitis]|uniref:substrate-binding periplasmic protein n=1 Tax=Chromobacterium amazonense TaxID=1382803 RepID=UPI0021B711CA|nr:transporter substrate-binding domain-containing protein [Chromobacterium amazonense]MBM2883178.1 transporter substrate-binding domain-containing protein [Chromobacterium amazonense]MDE1716104.1 transporter substrate-binding domain-containing protein [Chromobacterium amazonense]
MESDGQLTGIWFDLGNLIFSKAGIDYAWKSLPTNRLFGEMQNNIGRKCSIGWFKTPEREKFAKFSQPIYSDPRVVALVRKDSTLPDSISAKELLSLSTTHLIVKKNFSQGVYLDKLIKIMPAENVIVTSADYASIVKMILAGHGNVFIITPVGIKNILEEAGGVMEQFRAINLLDVPIENERRIMCTASVPDEVMKKLNQTIGKIPKQYIDKLLIQK